MFAVLLPGVLQSVAVCCSLLWCVAVCCSVLQDLMPHVRRASARCVALCYRVLQCVIVCCSVLLH